jgi:hypothetical protein
MPLLDLKGYRNGKRDEKTVQEVSSRHRSFFIDVSNAHRLHQIISILQANRQWAFVWTRRRRTENYYYLRGYITFETPHTENWFRTNLGNGVYGITTQAPIEFIDSQRREMSTFSRRAFEMIIHINDG